MVHAACTNWGGLMAARFFLGVGGGDSYTNNLLTQLINAF